MRFIVDEMPDYKAEEEWTEEDLDMAQREWNLEAEELNREE